MHSMKNCHVSVYQKKKKQINLVDVKGKERELKRAGNSGHTTASFLGTRPEIPLDVGSSRRRIKMEKMRDGAVRVSYTERIRVTTSGSGNTAVEDSGASHGDWWFPTVPLGHTVFLSISLALST